VASWRKGDEQNFYGLCASFSARLGGGAMSTALLALVARLLDTRAARGRPISHTLLLWAARLCSPVG